MKFKNPLTEPLSVKLEPSDEFILVPGNTVTVKHYNGYTIKFDSPGFCKFIYRGGFGFDIEPLEYPKRDIEITLAQPLIKSSL